MHWFVGLVCWVAVVLTLAFFLWRVLSRWSLARPASSWHRLLIKPSREEKANLTRTGLYNANGYLIKTESEDFVGENFHRFDSVDSEYSMTALTIFPVSEAASAIPPQPLRPAPNIIPQEPRSPNSFNETSTDSEKIFLDKADSFYHYNISTAMTRSLISSEPTKNLISDNSVQPSVVFSPLEKIEKALNTEENDQNDWNTRRNLNIYKKPEYISTNPFLTNGNEINCQFNPFYENAFLQTSFSGNEDQNLSQNNDTNNESENAKSKTVYQFNRFSFIRKNSFENENQTEDGTTAGGSGQPTFRRAISCDSVSSDTSLGPLESPQPTVTGQLCLSLRCYRINSNDSLLAVNVIEARNLTGESPDTYVGIFLSPDHQGGHFKSKVCRGTNCPSYNETFLVDIGKSNRKLKFHIYATEKDACTLIGEAELSLQDASSYKQPVTTWLTLTDTEQGEIKFGELMLSTSYLPTAERLTLILTRARRLPNPIGFNLFVKVYLQKNGKKVAKKRSSIKRSEISPAFNEAFIFSVPPQLLSVVQLRVSLVYFPVGADYTEVTRHQKIGHILLSREAHGKAGNHWNQMVTSLRKPITMWHALRVQHD